jgi:hypothetical protein
MSQMLKAHSQRFEAGLAPKPGLLSKQDRRSVYAITGRPVRRRNAAV